MQKTIVGNISSNLSFGYSKEKGMAVVTFSVAVNGKERQGDTWVDKEPVLSRHRQSFTRREHSELSYQRHACHRQR